MPELLHGKRPPQNTTCGARRVATRLAVLGFFHFRRVLQEDPDTVSPSSQLSRTSVPLRTQCWGSARLRSHGTRVRDSPSPVPGPCCWKGSSCLQIDETRCSGCQSPLDPLGRHSAACPRTGRLRKRATPIERVLARVCREAGARVRFNAFLRDMNIGVGANDGRRIEVPAQDLPCFGGAQLAVDVTLRCALARMANLTRALPMRMGQCLLRHATTKKPRTQN